MTVSAHAGERPPKPSYPPFSGLPDYPALRELQQFPQWVSWGPYWKEDKQKWDKPPINPKTGELGSPTDASTWSSYDQAARRTKQDGLAGVGFALDVNGNISGIDLDRCRDPETGEFQAWAQVAIDFGETYAEVSPSGRGLRFFVLGLVDGRKIDAAQVEIYTKGRYLTVTGEHVDGTPTEIRAAPKLIAYLQERADQFREAQRAAAEMAREAERKRQEREAARAAEAGEQPRQSTSERATASVNGRGDRIHQAFADAAGPDPFWRAVNSRALANLDAWVPVLIPAARRAGGGVWRATSRNLGRDLEEDLSISPDGIKDFGTHDMGHPNEGKYTPIALVLEYAAASTAAEAALWLCRQIGVDAESLGWRGGGSGAANDFDYTAHGPGASDAGTSDAGSPDEAKAPPLFKARPFAWIDPTSIPVREWLLERHLIRRFISVTAAPGGVGKSSLVLAEALSLAAGKNLIGHRPHGRFKTLLWNGEDPLEEMQRRVMAACLFYNLDRDDIEGHLFVNSGRDDPIVVAVQAREGVTIAVPVVDAIKATIRENAIDVVIIDPFVSCHAVSENDNMAIDRVAKLWGKIAHDTGCAVELVHHTRKTGGNETVMEDLRGAVALLSASRSGRILNVMSKEEGERAGVQQPRLYFRVDSGKANLAPPPSEGSSWFKLESVPLGNGPPGLLDLGDSVGVVAAWEWPDPLAGMTAADLCAAQAAVRAGGPWRENIQANDWVGIPIAQTLKLDPNDKGHREKVKRMLKVWIETGMFVVVTGKNEKGRPTPFVEVGEDART